MYNPFKPSLRMKTADQLMKEFGKTVAVSPPTPASVTTTEEICRLLDIESQRYPVPPNLDQIRESHHGERSIIELGNTVEFRSEAKKRISEALLGDVHVIWMIHASSDPVEIMSFLRGFVSPYRIVRPGSPDPEILASFGKAKVFVVKISDTETVRRLSDLTHRAAEFAVIGFPSDPVFNNAKFNFV